MDNIIIIAVRAPNYNEPSNGQNFQLFRILYEIQQIKGTFKCAWREVALQLEQLREPLQFKYHHIYCISIPAYKMVVGVLEPSSFDKLYFKRLVPPPYHF